MTRFAILLCLVACEKARVEPTPLVIDARPAPRDPVDFVLAIDLSKSMEETDLAPDRLGATTHAVRGFLREVAGDRVGVVIYAQTPAVKSPLTADLEALDASIAKLAIGEVPELGTAMGDGLALAVDQLAGSKAKRRVVIVLADGENNWVTKYDPDQAAAKAVASGIIVHTILVGNESTDAFGGMAANPKQLEAIAATTGGVFKAATDAASFERGLKAIVAQTRRP